MPNYLHPKKINSILIISLVFAIVARAFLEWILFDLPSDKKTQIATALNLIDGHGISIAYVEAKDLSKIIYEKVGLWPPGYALTIAPFIMMGLTPIRSTILLDIFAILVLFYSFYLIFNFLKNSIHYGIPVFFFIFYGISLQPFNVLFSSGLVALSLCVLAIYILLKNLNSTVRWYDYFVLGILSFLPSFFHFSYYPVSVILPFLFLLYAVFIDSSKRKPALLNFSLCLILIAAQLAYQATLPTGMNYLNEYHPETSGAPYWKNLKMFINLPLYFLTDGFVVKRYVERIDKNLFIMISTILWMVFISLMIYLKVILFRKIKEEGLNYLKKLENQFIVICLILSWVLVVFLIFLSLKYPHEDAGWMPNNEWTYVIEARYYSLIIMLFPLAIIIALWNYFPKPFLKITLFSILITGFLFSASINFFYMLKYGSGTPEENFGRYYHHNYGFGEYLDERIKKSKDHLLVFGPDTEVDEYTYISILKQIPLLKLEEMNKDLNASEPVTLLVNFSEKLEPREKKIVENFVDKHNLTPVKEFPELQIRIYELHLP